MNKFLLAFFILLILVSGSLAAIPHPTSAHTAPAVWEASFLPCTLELCGHFPQNVATLGADTAEVSVNSNGRVRLSLKNLTIPATGEIAAHKTLQVLFGSFTTLATEHILLGTIVTDAAGNYSGGIETGGGSTFVFLPGTTASGQFVLNNPGVRSEFITGFQIP